MSDDSPGGRSLAYARAAMGVLGLVLAVSAGATLAGIGLVALLARRGDDVTWSRWSNVGESFGVVNSLISVLAVAAVVVTWSSQDRLLREQRTDLAEQRQVEERRADLELRKMHVDLIRMALEKRHLAEVWPRIAGADPIVEAQHMYANLVLQHLWLEHSLGKASRDQMINNVQYVMASPAMRAFWRDTEDSRRSVYAEKTEQAGFIAEVDEIWRQYEAVVACSADRPESATVNRRWADDDLNGTGWSTGPARRASGEAPPESTTESSSPPA